VTVGQLAPYLPWLASRSAGIVAFCLVSASVILGLAMSTRITTPALRVRLRGVHEQLAVAGLIAIAAHGLVLLGDGWLHASPVNLVVPFTLGYRTLFTGLGVLAGWGAALFGLSYYARRRIGAARWRRLHRASFVVWLLGATHAIGAGSDNGTLFLRILVIGSAIPIGALVALRLGGGATRPAPVVPPAPVPVAPPSTLREPLWSRPRN
jgi:sulfoxide reductase heme-binding subunit YedZ